jgi:hypothetical protein
MTLADWCGRNYHTKTDIIKFKGLMMVLLLIIFNNYNIIQSYFKTLGEFNKHSL